MRKTALIAAVSLIALSISLNSCKKENAPTVPVGDAIRSFPVSVVPDTILLRNAYGVPDENSVDISSTGIGNWTNNADIPRVYVTFNQTGTIATKLLAKSPDGPGVVTIYYDGQIVDVNVPQSNSYQAITVGNLNVPSTGIKYFQIKGKTKPGGYYADVQALIISGTPATTAYYNKSTYRTCPAIHVGYSIPSGNVASWFYNEIKVSTGSDLVNTFFMANGFYGGYFGIQVNSPTERRIIFSVFSDYDGNDPNQVPADYAVRLVSKGSLVTTEEVFGNEGTGRHAIATYSWAANTTYKFLVHSVPDAGGVTYTGFIYLNNQWKLMAKYYKPISTYNMDGLYSFVEDFGGGLNSYKGRTMLAQNQWIVTPAGSWVQLKNGQFTTTTHDDVFSRVDYGASVSGTGYSMFTGGFVPKTASDYQNFTCNTGTQPVVTLPE
ncbi:protein of unknown function [Mucilaginibacter pineti]|uniref:DUF5077 domain-containing protein n=1 Tax=Mucilaginibacter pineti TaxID=1391627 RepID=A0A1G7LPD5_9SPHI|nr:DUF5077 domain-containing protein [Mucilaginibacter pineti]SDF51283.1 protein of unknown function [Mucilaginibacter pineti]